MLSAIIPELTQWIMLGTFIAMIIGLFLTWRQIRLFAKQLDQSSLLQKEQAKQSFFAEYTRRYQEIVLNMPDNEDNLKWKKYVIMYFDLCSEEFFLRDKKKLIDNDIWELWEDGMKTEMKNPSYQKEWKARLWSRYSDESFVRFVNQCMNH